MHHEASDFSPPDHSFQKLLLCEAAGMLHDGFSKTEPRWMHNGSLVLLSTSSSRLLSILVLDPYLAVVLVDLKLFSDVHTHTSASNERCTYQVPSRYVYCMYRYVTAPRKRDFWRENPIPTSDVVHPQAGD